MYSFQFSSLAIRTKIAIIAVQRFLLGEGKSESSVLQTIYKRCYIFQGIENFTILQWVSMNDANK